MKPNVTTRRRFLQLSSVAAVGGFAGCIADTGSADSDETPVGTTTGTTTAATGTEPGIELETAYDSRERFGSPGTSFDDFEDASAWKPIAGAMEVDTGTVFEGEQSLKLYGVDGNPAGVERTLSAEDFSGVDLSLALRTTTPDQFALYVRLVDAYGDHAIFELNRLTYRGPDVGWFRTCPGVYETSDPAPDLSQVERMQIVATNPGGEEVELWIDDLRTHEKPETGYLVLSWDDGRSSYYEDAAPIQDEFGFPGVMAAVPRFTNGRNFMSPGELEERQAAGDQIVAHASVEHPFHELDADELDRLLGRNKQWFIDNGLDGADFVVYPGNNYDATALDVVSRYHYVGGMNQAGDVNTTGVGGFDPLVLPRTIGHDLDIAKRVVDRVAAHRNCGILNFHDFAVENTMSEADYRSLLEYVDAQGDTVEVITLADLWALRTA